MCGSGLRRRLGLDQKKGKKNSLWPLSTSAVCYCNRGFFAIEYLHGRDELILHPERAEPARRPSSANNSLINFAPDTIRRT